MTYLPPISAVVTGYGHWVPDRVVTSSELEERVRHYNPKLPMAPGSIAAIAGVEERRWVEPGTTSSDLAARAAEMAMANADVDPLAVDLIIFASASHDVSEPATSAIVQHKSGCANATFFDVKNACNSFLNGLDVAAAHIATGRARRVVVTSGEVISPTANLEIENLKDLQLKFAGLTLGDAGAAMVVEATDAEEAAGRGLSSGRYYSDGSHWDLSVLLYGGTLMGRDNSRWFFECQSTELQKLAAEHLPPLVLKAVDEAGWAADDVSLVVPHQVSMSIIDAVTDVFDFSRERCAVTLDRFGNTAAASIPLALSVASAEGRIAPNDNVLMVCGAAGFTAGVMPFVA